MQRHIEDIINEKGIYVSKTKGDSMEPMLHEGRDTVVLKKCPAHPKKYDVVLFKAGEKYILHRIVGIKKDGTYVTLGDNRISKEYGIKKSDIIAVLDSFYKGKKHIRCDSPEYIKYARAANKRYRKEKIKALAYGALKKMKIIGRRGDVKNEKI